MITPNEFHTGLLIKLDGTIYEVVEYQRNKTAQRRARVRTRLRDIRTGAALEQNFDSGERLEDVEVERKRATFLYRQERQYVFMDMDTYDQYTLPDEILKETISFLVENLEVAVLFHEGQPFDIEIPRFVDLTVVETNPDFRGDTATGSSKPARLSTGLVVPVPFFISPGERIRVDTRTKTYIERVGK